MTTLCVDGHVNLSPRAEGEIRLEAERVGGLEVERDEAVASTASYNFLSDTVVLLEAVL